MDHNNRKILFLTLNTFSSFGGIEDVCKTLCKVLEDLKFNFKVLSMNDYEVDEKYLNPSNFIGFGQKKLNFGINAIKIGLKYDTIILSHINLLLFARILKFFKPSLKIIVYAHGIEVWRELPKWKINFLKKKVEIWAVSSYTSNFMQNEHKIPSQNFKILNNCLNPFFVPPLNFEKPEYLLRRYKIENNQPILYTLTRISSFEKYKGYDIVINILPELIKNFPNLLYIISGKADSDERDRLVKLIKKLKLEDHVFLTGFIENAELSDHFLLANCFVLPSKKEGFGIVFIESAACGCKIIAGNKDGSKDAILNGKLGLLVDPDNKNEIFKGIKTILENNQTKNEAEFIQKICLEHFSFETYKANVSALLS
ncbi:glycosyltransferase family 4 protein [Pedobacter flavus]|uniref:Glycosyltransferase family 4 protein n=1 Tax=Pedobacter flavus TaxID=3113906 RepID=A0ABU7GYF6_9SPHI|nr:glycosyltransferase family 4 protein [Pedobacter sp. VNH31]MEE1883907.1 glycosyltransferase family 4 protein [Pedobacter sp. VNH31]